MFHIIYLERVCLNYLLKRVFNYLISNYKAKYLELLKSDCEIPDIIRDEMEKKVAQDMAKNYKYNQ